MNDDYKDPGPKDTRPLDPYNPASLGTGPGAGYDQYGNARFEPEQERGRAPFILLGILVAIGVIGGLLYFNHSPRDRETAQVPTITDVQPAPPAPPTAPGVSPLNGTTGSPRGTMTAPSDSGAATPANPPMGRQ
jgi:hypothetical protein